MVQYQGTSKYHSKCNHVSILTRFFSLVLTSIKVHVIDCDTIEDELLVKSACFLWTLNPSSTNYLCQGYLFEKFDIYLGKMIFENKLHDARAKIYLLSSKSYIITLRIDDDHQKKERRFSWFELIRTCRIVPTISVQLISQAENWAIGATADRRWVAVIPLMW